MPFEWLQCWKINYVFALMIHHGLCDHPTHSPKTLFPVFDSTSSSLSSVILQNPECYTWLLANLYISPNAFSHSWHLYDYICTGDLFDYFENHTPLTEEQVRPIIHQVSWAYVDGIRDLWCLSCGLKAGYFKWIRFVGNSYLRNHPLSQSFLSRRLLCSASCTERTSCTET